jgi:N-acetylglucosamine-6-phosphate deacetylase
VTPLDRGATCYDPGSEPAALPATDMPHPPPQFAVLGRLVDDGVDLGETAVVIDAGRVAARHPIAGGEPLPAFRFRAPIVAPGFVDLQVNGGFGLEVGEDADALVALAGRLPETGVTLFLPTLVSRPEADYAAAFAAFERAVAARPPGARPAPGARIGGLHLEGPLLARARAGAHDPASIEAASAAGLARILATAPSRHAHGAGVALITLAPERDQTIELIADLTARGIGVSLGHTDASFDLATRAIDAGARFATHVWNAMPPLHHRAPGVVGAALTDDRVTALFIADGLHLHRAILKLGLAAKPPGRRAIVSDAISAAGLPSNPDPVQGHSQGQGPRPADLRVARLAGQTLRLDGPAARLPDGTLAGATVPLDQALRNVRAGTELGTAEILRLATATPGSALGGRAGRLEVGDAADLVLLDAELNVLVTFVGGELAFVRGGDVDAFRA